MPDKNSDNPANNSDTQAPAVPVDDNSQRDNNSQRSDNNSADDPLDSKLENAKNSSAMMQAVDRVKDADNILVALSRDPSVDEMAAAIGLTMMLDQIGKHATAIYSGKTPNALEFLEPEKTFETNTNSLQDFIIALNKDKVDHLRYKIEDDFVKVYITPYRTTIEEQDLQFSHGDINVDLVISLNVKNVEDLDAALAQHGRIMHDASAVNISNDTPGELDGIQWNDTQASSVSEMVVKLIDQLDEKMPEEVATALLTGVVAATDRFSNEKTTSETMEVSAKLMDAGANQQLVAVNIEKKDEAANQGSDAKNSDEQAAEGQAAGGQVAEEHAAEGAILSITKDRPEAAVVEEMPKVTPVEPSATEPTPEQQLEKMIANPSPERSLMDELRTSTPEELNAEPAEVLKGSVPEVASAPETVSEPIAPVVASAPETVSEPIAPVVASAPEPVAPVPEPTVTSTSEPIPAEIAPPAPETPLFGEQQISPVKSTIDQQVVIPSAENEPEAAVPSTAKPGNSVYITENDMTNLQDGKIDPIPDEAPKDYGAMMEKELASAAPSPFANPAMAAVPEVATAPEAQSVVTEMQPVGQPVTAEMQPAMGAQPTVPEVQPVMGAQPTIPEVQPAAPENIELPAAPSPVIPEATAMDATLPPVQPMPVDESAAVGVPAAPEGIQQEAPKEELNPVIVQPEPMQPEKPAPNPLPTQPEPAAAQPEPARDPALVPPVQDPGAFKIPGM